MKKIAFIITLLLMISLVAGCTGNAPAQTQTPVKTTSPSAAQSPTTTGDAVSSASIVNDSAAFIKAISKTGTWIICLTKDLAVNQDLLLEGEFKNGKKDADGKDVIQRKIALYAQDANRNITARYTLTAPKLTITSPNASIQHGTFKGDLYISVNDFQLVDAKVDGNVYFSSDEVKKSFKMDATSSVTGKQEIKK